MKVKFTLNNGQAFTTRITYGFESTSDLADHLSRALGQATSDSVVKIETKNRVFLARPTDIVSEAKGSRASRGRANKYSVKPPEIPASPHYHGAGLFPF